MTDIGGDCLRCGHCEGYGCNCTTEEQQSAYIDHLIAANDAQDAKIKALVDAGERDERAHGNTIDQRDAMESAFARAYELVMGRPIEWSSAYHTDEALHDMEAALAAAKETT